MATKQGKSASKKQQSDNKNNIYLQTNSTNPNNATTHVTLLDRENNTCYQFILTLVHTFGMAVVTVKERFRIKNLSGSKIAAVPVMFHNPDPFKVNVIFNLSFPRV